MPPAPRTAPPTAPPLREKASYALGDFGLNLYWSSISAFLLIFYTDVMLLPAAAVGTLILVTKIGDAIADPLMGMLADRTRTRWGHFRPWLLWGALPLAATGVLAFTVPPLGADMRLLWAYVTFSLMMLAYTVVSIPYSALSGGDYRRRPATHGAGEHAFYRRLCRHHLRQLRHARPGRRAWPGRRRHRLAAHLDGVRRPCRGAVRQRVLRRARARGAFAFAAHAVAPGHRRSAAQPAMAGVVRARAGDHDHDRDARRRRCTTASTAWARPEPHRLVPRAAIRWRWR